MQAAAALVGLAKNTCHFTKKKKRKERKARLLKVFELTGFTSL